MMVKGFNSYISEPNESSSKNIKTIGYLCNKISKLYLIDMSPTQQLENKLVLEHNWNNLLKN